MQRGRLLEELVLNADNYDTVAIESVAGGYARIKHEMPDLVIVYLTMDDVAVCGLLAMLTLDPETSTIPVVTWAERYDDGSFERLLAAMMREPSGHAIVVPVN